VNHLSLLPLAGALILTASVAWSANEPAAPISVVMKSISYDPKSVEVPVGGSIVWTNKAFTNHTATSEDDGKAWSKNLRQDRRRLASHALHRQRRRSAPFQRRALDALSLRALIASV